VERSSVT